MKRFYSPSLLGITIIAFAWFLFDGGSKIDRLRFYRFDDSDWRHATASQRYFMSEYLIDHHTLSEHSRAEIIGLLGDETISTDSSNVLIYDLGRKRGWEMDTEPRLVILFNPDGKVREYRIVSFT